MTQIVTAQNNKVLLNTLLDETMFSKTQFTRFMSGKGFLVSKDKDQNFKIFQDWIFDGAVTVGETVYFYANGFSGTPVALIEDENLLKESLFGICQAIDFAITNQIPLPCNSPNGILLSQDHSTLLFIPEAAFEKSAEHLPKADYQQIQGAWLDKTLSGKNALLFLQATVAYFALCKELPYPAEQDQAQSVNIYDKNFLPLKYQINGIRNELESIDKILCASTYSAKAAKETSVKQIPLDILEDELFHPEQRVALLSEKDFQKQKDRFVKNQSKKIKARRFIRRNKVIGITAGVLIAAALAVYISISNEKAKRHTIKGMDSTQSTLVFYKGLHTMDSDLMKLAAKDCSDAQKYIQSIPTIFSTYMIASSFNFQAGISRPESWFFFEPMSQKAFSRVIFGLTNVTIDDEPSLLELNIPTFADKPLSQRSENGIILKNGSSATHKVHYYLVHTQDAMLRIEDTTTKVTLHFNGDEWQISSMEENAQIKDISPIEFSKQLKEAMENADNDVIMAVESLREEHPWIPSKQSLLKEEKKIQLQG